MAGRIWLAERVVEDEFTFVTNNRVDFIRLFSKMELHAGLIVLVPNVSPLVQRALFVAATQYLGKRDLTYALLEVTLDREAVRIAEYQWPSE